MAPSHFYRMAKVATADFMALRVFLVMIILAEKPEVKSTTGS